MHGLKFAFVLELKATTAAAAAYKLELCVAVTLSQLKMRTPHRQPLHRGN